MLTMADDDEPKDPDLGSLARGKNSVRARQKRTPNRPTKRRRSPSKALLAINSAKILTGMERERKVIEYKAEGKTFQQIADLLDYKGASGASEAYYRAIGRALPGAPEMQAIELSKIDSRERDAYLGMRVIRERLQLIVDGKGDKIDAYKCIDSLSKLDNMLNNQSIRKAKLTGIDAPNRSVVTGEVKHTMDGDLIKSQLIASLDALVSQVKDDKAITVEAELPQLPESSDPGDIVVEAVLAKDEEDEPEGEGQ